MLQRLLVDDGRRALVFLIIRHDDHLRELVRLFFEYDHQGFRLPAFTLTSLSTWFRYETFNVYSVPFVPVNRNFPSRSVETPVPSSAMNIVAKLSGLPSESRTTPSTVALSVCAKSAEHRPDIKKGYEYQFLHLSPRHSIPVSVYGPAPLSGTGITELSEYPREFPGRALTNPFSGDYSFLQPSG